MGQHKRIHLIEKKFKCDLCGKCFVMGQYLKQHQKTHINSKTFQCDVCNSFHENTLSQDIWACIRERKISFAKYVTKDSP